MEVDIISKDGHYIFHGLVLENNLNRSDIHGRYCLITRQLGHVRLINQRAAFRIPTDKRVNFEIQNCDIELRENQVYLEARLISEPIIYQVNEG